jgi:transposase-like protein
MEKKNTAAGSASIPCWEDLESCLRMKMRSWIQDMLNAEVDELLGRTKFQRRKGIDAPPGYRNGYGKPRKLTLSHGTVTVRRPRVRGLDQRFESRLLPLFARRSPEVNELLPELYLHGLAQGDFDLALRGLLGEDAPISANTIARLKAKWQAEWEEWSSRWLGDLEVVYLWVDGVHVKAGFEKEKAAVLVVLAALSDGRKVIVAVRAGYRESKEAWAEMLRDLKRRGMNCPRVVVGDGHLGIWSALGEIYPEAEEQRCWNHRILNALDKVPKKLQAQALVYLRQIPYADSRKEAERLKLRYQGWCREKGLEEAAEVLDRDWERMITFYGFPKEHWQHLRTSNPIESPFSALRLRTDAARRFKKIENALAVIWKMLLVAERRFRRLNAPELMREVYEGATYVDGIKVVESSGEAVA